MTPESLNSTLAALRKAGSVFGVLFSRGSDTLFSDLAYAPERVGELTQVLDDIDVYFEQEGRKPDYLSFSYDGGNLVLLMRQGHRLVILHHHADDSDFILVAGSAFLTDYFSGVAAESFQNSRKATPSVIAPSPRSSSPSKRVVDPTAPITPAMR